MPNDFFSLPDGSIQTVNPAAPSIMRAPGRWTPAPRTRNWPSLRTPSETAVEPSVTSGDDHSTSLPSTAGASALHTLSMRSVSAATAIATAQTIAASTSSSTTLRMRRGAFLLTIVTSLLHAQRPISVCARKPHGARLRVYRHPVATAWRDSDRIVAPPPAGIPHARVDSICLLTAAVAVLLLSVAVSPAAAQWQLESKDGTSSIKFGVLIQPQAELLETADQEATSTNLFVRRLRLVVGGALGEHWSFFFETDSPNLGKTNPNAGVGTPGLKDQGDLYVQDAYLTYSRGQAFKVDAGMMMLPHSRHGTQSAATLLAVDYGPYTFLDSGPGGERVGRDYGVQLRGYPAGQKLEYRLAVSQGVRGPEARNPLRITGRAVYYPFGAETGFFYGGTFQGTKRQLGVGGGFDVQEDASIYSADFFFETPLFDKPAGLHGPVQLDALRRRLVPARAGKTGCVPRRSRVPCLETPVDAVRAVPGEDVRQRRHARPGHVPGWRGVVAGGAPAQPEVQRGPPAHRRAARPDAGAGAVAALLLLRNGFVACVSGRRPVARTGNRVG